ncbi:MAG: hypothetical protein AAF616_05685 [Bacteroidota bacterium]
MVDPKTSTSWKAIILCFIGATTFWFFSALGKEYSYRIKYPIEFIFDADSLVAVQPLPDFVEVDVSGGGWDLFKESFWFGARPVKFELENPAAIRFLTRPTILPILTEELSQYEVNFLFTDTLYINIDRKTSQWMKLEFDSSRVSLEEGYRFTSPITISPDTVKIHAPTSYFDSLNGILKFWPEESGIDEDFSAQVPILLPDGFGISSDPQDVSVSFKVDRFTNVSLISTVEMINFPADSSVFVDNPEIDVKFLSLSADADNYTAGNFSVIVDFDMINQGDSTVPAIVIVEPQEVSDVRVEPDTLKVKYEKK